MYCVYLTTYLGNKLPPFYIGSSSEKRIQEGYRGSVSSTQYANVWKQELKNNPHLFKIRIIKLFETKKESLKYERKIHMRLDVAKNDLYCNKKIAVVSDMYSTSKLGTIFVNKNKKNSMIEKYSLPEYIENGYCIGFYASEDFKRKASASTKDTKPINNGSIEKRIPKDKEIPEGWSIGRLPESDETRKRKSISHLGKPNLSLKNKTTVKDQYGNTFSVSIDDPKFISGEYKGINSGKKGIANHLNEKIHECPHCKKITNKGNYRKWHGEKCKFFTESLAQ